MQPLPYLPKPSPAELGAAKLEPLYVESAKDVEATFAEMLPHFAGKETGENWLRREQSALKIRRLTCGNAPEDYLPQYTAAVKSMSDALIKGCTSLRTTLCTEACHCVQDIARTLKQGLDPVVEVCELSFLLSISYTDSNTLTRGSCTGLFPMFSQAVCQYEENYLSAWKCLYGGAGLTCHILHPHQSTPAQRNPRQERATTTLCFRVVDDCADEIWTTTGAP